MRQEIFINKMTSLMLRIVMVFLIALLNEGLSSEDLISSTVPTDNPFHYGSSNVENTSPSLNIPVSGDAIDLNSKEDRELSSEDNGHTLEGEVVPAPDHLEGTFGAEESLNNSANNSSNNTEISEEKGNITSIVACNTEKENGGQPVELVNSTRLVSILITESNVTDRRTNADCTLVLFYARYCPFSSMAAPHFNALPRAFPDIKLAAVDAMKYHSFNTQYGIVGVPTLMLFHNGRPAAKFNDSEYNLEAFAKFITKYTGLQPHDKLYVTSADFGGPVSSVPTKETDYCLILSWAFMFICGLYFFSKSSWWRWISEAIQNTWREAEAQHEHGD